MKIKWSSYFLLLWMAANTMTCSGASSTNNAEEDTSTGNQNDSATSSSPVVLNGAINKGPFITGSTVNISPVSNIGNSTGDVFSTQTNNELGEFTIEFDHIGYASLEGTGFYYNEVTGSLSGANLTLRAFYDVTASGNQQAYINLITHLTYNRVRHLLANGIALESAVSQAEEELMLALAIVPNNFILEKSGTEMVITGGDTLANAYLLAVSSVITQIAILRGEDSLDANLQETLNTYSSDFEDGNLLNKDNEIARAKATINPQIIMDMLASRLVDIGSEAVVPNINRAIDQDGDGLLNIDDDDIDNDGVTNAEDEAPYDPAVASGMFFDHSRNLSWERDPENTTVSFDEAQSYCDELTLGGYDDWRIPSISELRSIISGCPFTEVDGACEIYDDNVDGSECAGCLDTQGPGVNGCYWNDKLLGICSGVTHWSTVSPSNNLDFAYTIYFQLGRIVQWPKEQSAEYVRCVRTILPG